MIIRKGDMILHVEWDIKINETRKYEQHIIAGYLPARVRQYGKRLVKLDKEWFFGQAEKHKESGEWIQDSIRIIRIPENIDKEEAEKILLRLGNVFLWFLAKVTKKTFALIGDRFEILALFGQGIGRSRILEEISTLRSKYMYDNFQGNSNNEQDDINI